MSEVAIAISDNPNLFYHYVCIGNPGRETGISLSRFDPFECHPRPTFHGSNHNLLRPFWVGNDWCWRERGAEKGLEWGWRWGWRRQVWVSGWGLSWRDERERRVDVAWRADERERKKEREMRKMVKKPENGWRGNYLWLWLCWIN